MEFVKNGHTVVLPPHNKWVDILTRDGVITKHSSAGTFDCAKYNFRIDDDWLRLVIKCSKHPADLDKPN
jgi:hypothetical protein